MTDPAMAQHNGKEHHTTVRPRRLGTDCLWGSSVGIDALKRFQTAMMCEKFGHKKITKEKPRSSPNAAKLQSDKKPNQSVVPRMR